MNIIFKTSLSLVVWGMYFVSTSLFSTILTNYVALNQLQDTLTANTAFQMYQQYSGAIFLIPFSFTLLIFAKDIQKFINDKKGE